MCLTLKVIQLNASKQNLHKEVHNGHKKKNAFSSLIIVRVKILPPHDINLKPIFKLNMKNLIPIFTAGLIQVGFMSINHRSF